MAATYRSSGTIVAGGGAGIDMSSALPSGLAINDIMIFVGMDADNEYFDAAMPDGWTVIDSDNTNTNLGGTFAWKRYDGTEIDWQFDTPSGVGNLVCGVIHAFQGVIKTGNPIGIFDNNSVVQSTSITVMGQGSEVFKCAVFIIEDNVSVTRQGIGVGNWTQRDNQTTTVGSDGRFILDTSIINNTSDIQYGTGSTEYLYSIGFDLIPETNRPTIVPNTADAHDFGADNTPTLEFTGSDANDDDLEYEFEILSAINTDVDKYVESNQNTSLSISDASIVGRGQSFTGNGDYLTKATFYLNKFGSPTGFARAHVYAHSGTFGTSSIATGNPLASSDFLDVSTLTGSLVLTDFLFDGTVQMINTTKYVITIEYNQGGASNFIRAGADNSSPTHGGNQTQLIPPTWSATSVLDLIFYIEGITRELNKLSSVPDAEFTNTTDGGDTHPFDQPDLIDYTVQGGNALADGTWYWRARAKDTGGTNQWSDWTAIRSFDIGSSGATLVVQDSFHAHTADNIVLIQDHTLVIVDSSHGHTSDNLTLIQDHTLVVAESLHAHDAEGDLTIVMKFTLIVADTVHNHDAENTVLTQDHTLTVAESLHAHTTDNLALIQDHNLLVAESLHGHTADNLTLSVSITLTVQESLHTHLSDNLLLTQSNVLVVNDSLHDHLGEGNLILVEKEALVVQDTLHAHSVDNIILTQANILVVEDTIHSHLSDSLTITQKHILATTDTLHSHIVDNTLLTQKSTLIANDTLHNHLSDNVILTQEHILAVNDSLHFHSVDNIVLSVSTLLVAEDSLHGHLSDNLVLVQKHILIVQETLHGHIVDNVDLIEKFILVINDTVHNHLSDNLSLSQSFLLLLQDTLHSHSVDNLILVLDNILSVNSTVHIHTADNILLITKFTTMVGKFPTGSIVTITIYDLFDDSVIVNGANSSEINTTGLFKYELTGITIPNKEFAFTMTDGITEQFGKVVFREDLLADVSYHVEESVWDVNSRDEVIQYSRKASDNAEQANLKL